MAQRDSPPRHLASPRPEGQRGLVMSERVLVMASLFALYVIWGSTYFAMRTALAVFPPFAMAGPRFIVAGGLMFGLLRWRGAELPTRRQWRNAATIGVLLLVCGNGLVAVAMRTVDSGVAATVIATMPLWAALFGAILGTRPTARELFGLALGFFGIFVLKRGGNLSFASSDAIVLLGSPIAWALGSVLSRRLELPNGLLGTAVQMIVGGACMLFIAAVRDEHLRGPVTLKAAAALLYLTVFGSMLAFSAYGYLLRTTRPAIATSYAYVNPLVALALGSLLGGESFTPTKLLACGLTVAGVIVVTTKLPARTA